MTKLNTIALITFMVMFISCNRNNKPNKILVPFLKTNNKYVFVDSATMHTSIDKEFDECRLFHEGLAAVKLDGKWGYINEMGKEVIRCQFYNCDDFYRGIAKYTDSPSYKSGFLTTAGTILTPAIYRRDDISRLGFDHLLANAYCEKLITNIIPYGYRIDLVDTLNNGIFAVRIDNGTDLEIPMIWRYFLVNINLEKVSAEFDGMKEFHEGYAAVCRGKRMTYKWIENANWGFIDKSGKLQIPLKYATVSSFSDGLAAVNPIENQGKYGFINQRGDWVIQPKYEYAWDFSEGFAAVKLNNKVGFIDKNDNINIDFIYPNGDGVNTYIYSHGFAAVNTDNGKINFINKTGKLICKKSYDHVEKFDDCIALVGLGEELYGSDGYAGFSGKWGLIDTNGKELTKIKYDDIHRGDITNSSNNLLLVEVNGVKYYIDRNGREFKQEK